MSTVVRRSFKMTKLKKKLLLIESSTVNDYNEDRDTIVLQQGATCSVMIEKYSNKVIKYTYFHSYDVAEKVYVAVAETRDGITIPMKPDYDESRHIKGMIAQIL